MMTQGVYIEITDEICQEAEDMAGRGLNMEQIALALGFSTSALYAKQKNEPELKAAIERGRARGIHDIANSLYESAKKGNVAAQIFYLKNRSPDTWKDARYIPDAEDRTPAGPVTVNIVDGRAEPDPATG